MAFVNPSNQSYSTQATNKKLDEIPQKNIASSGEKGAKYQEGLGLLGDGLGLLAGNEDQFSVNGQPDVSENGVKALFKFLGRDTEIQSTVNFEA